eukprot:CAMPEP_0114242814 /NCGR_PEP_ID=MMETSP0058-20121206/10397_1 /TAXON_ID=36894 /ORGANISM="Pyramimonas parkeae, CCMP726" /LENGTH=225 /DNA_ID=CAMNT_0001355493 /DNA_START=258 /DNA_END=935 /DNA_ORIENTATION=-
MWRQIGIGAVRTCSQVPTSGAMLLRTGFSHRAAAASVHTRVGLLYASASDAPAPEFKNVDFKDGLTGSDFDGPIDLDRPQVRTVGTPRVKALADEIVNLTLLEVNDLVEILTERLHLPAPSAMPMGGMPMGAAGMPPVPSLAEAASADDAKAEEKTEFDLKLESFDKAAKIKVIKEIRAVTDLGLKEAKELVEGAPCVIKKHMSKEDAETVIEKLKAVGAVVVMV